MRAKLLRSPRLLTQDELDRFWNNLHQYKIAIADQCDLDSATAVMESYGKAANLLSQWQGTLRSIDAGMLEDSKPDDPHVRQLRRCAEKLENALRCAYHAETAPQGETRCTSRSPAAPHGPPTR